MRGHACISRKLQWPPACKCVCVCSKGTPPRREHLKVRCVEAVAPSVARQRRTLATRALALNQNVTRAITPAARAPSDLALDMEAILGVTGVDKIWSEENTDDEDSSEERTFPCHTRRTLQALRARQKESADASTRSVQNSQPTTCRNTCVYQRSSA